MGKITEIEGKLSKIVVRVATKGIGKIQENFLNKWVGGPGFLNFLSFFFY